MHGTRYLFKFFFRCCEILFSKNVTVTEFSQQLPFALNVYGVKSLAKSFINNDFFLVNSGLDLNEIRRSRESARGLAQSRTLTRVQGRGTFRQVLDCGRPLPLSRP
jgi:hypothetical protein